MVFSQGGGSFNQREVINGQKLEFPEPCFAQHTLHTCSFQASEAAVDKRSMAAVRVYIKGLGGSPRPFI